MHLHRVFIFANVWGGVLNSYYKIKKEPMHRIGSHKNVLEGIRTPDPRLRRPLLYPTELRTHISFKQAGLVGFEPTNAGIKILCLTAWR